MKTRRGIDKEVNASNVESIEALIIIIMNDFMVTQTCLFPKIMTGAKARSTLKFRNVAFDRVDKPGPVGECIMTFNA